MDTARPIALIPLDDRPGHLRLPVHLARLAGRAVALPPRELLGHCTTPGQPMALGEWLRQQTTVEAALVAADMLAYGGFLAAHTLVVPESVAMAHLTALEDLRAAAPEVPVLAFSVLLGPIDGWLAGWLVGSSESSPRAPESASAQPTNQLTNQPTSGREEYDRLRARNHALHRRLVEYLAEGVIDYLLLVPEEAAAGGPPQAEREALEQLAAEHGVSNRLSMQPGVTATAVTLLTRVVLQAHGSPVRVAVRGAVENGRRTVPGTAEAPGGGDQPLRAAVEAFMGTTGALAVPHPEEADVVLFVNTPRGDGPAAPAGEGKVGNEGNSETTGLHHFVDEIAYHLAQGAAVALADVAFPQGADPLLLEELAQRVPLPHLAAYAGGGPASRRLGLALAQGCLAAVARGRDRAAAADERQRHVFAVFHRHFQKIAQLLQAEKTVVLLLDKSRQRLTPLPIATGFDQAELEALDFAAKAEFWSLALALQSVRLEAEHAMDLPGHHEVLAALGARNGLMVPLLSRRFRQDLMLAEERPMGLLCVLNKRRGTFTEEDETLLTLLARQAGAVLRNMRHVEAEWEHQELVHWLQTAQVQQQLLLLRFIKDWGYQSVVRPEIESSLPAGVSAWDLGEAHQAVEVQMRERLRAWTQTFLKTHWCGRILHPPRGAGRIRLPDEIPCRFSLPWPDTSEVEVEVSLTLEAVQ